MLVMVVGLDVGIWVSGETRDHQRGIIVPSEPTDTEPSSSDPTHISNYCSITARHQTLFFKSNSYLKIDAFSSRADFQQHQNRLNCQQKLYFSKLKYTFLHKNITALRHSIKHKAVIACISLQPFLLCKPSIFKNWLPKTSWLLFFSFSCNQLAETRPDPVQSPTYLFFTLDLGCSIWGLECCPISRWSHEVFVRAKKHFHYLCTNIEL